MQSNEKKSYEINYEKDIYLIEFLIPKDNLDSIVFKSHIKNNISNSIFSKNYTFEEISKLSKAFKICDNIKEIFDLISKTFEKKEVKINIIEKNKLNICFQFKLPNDKIEEIAIQLDLIQSHEVKDSLILEKLSELEEKNRVLEKEINNLKIENEKLKLSIGGNNASPGLVKNYDTSLVEANSGKMLFDLMSEKFCVSRYQLGKDFMRHLEDFGTTEDYKKELYNKFNSKVKKIYDVKVDGDTLICFMTKVFGKKNIITFHSLSNDIEGYLNVQLAYLSGKFEFKNNYFNFENTELYTYGDYQTVENGYCYTSFKQQNSKLYAKIEFDCIYIIFYEHGEINFIAKIRENFVNNPVLYIDEDKTKLDEFFENNPEEKVVELFNESHTKELNLTDLEIYQIEGDEN